MPNWFQNQIRKAFYKKDFAQIKEVLVLVNRGSKVEDKFSNYNIRLNSVITSETIFEILYEGKRIGKGILDDIKSEL